MNKKLKKKITKVAIGTAFYFAAVAVSHIFTDINSWTLLPFFAVAYIIIGGEVVGKAFKNLGSGRIFDENFLMTIATAGAFIVGDYSEAVAVMLFYQVGECFQSYAVNKSRKSIATLMNIRPDYANAIRNGDWEKISPDEVAVKELIMVRPGERVPLDGIVAKGSSSLDTMALTGESIPRDVAPGDAVISGCVNQSGVLEIKVTKEYGQSTVAKILDLVENAGNKKAEAENFITKFARYYTPIVVIFALALAIIPPFITGEGMSVWIYRALTFLVISCPCALVISIPLSFFGGLGGASRSGILVKGSNYLEALADAEVIVMDKTGTLTKGNFAVTQVVPSDKAQEGDFVAISAEYRLKSTGEILLELAAYAECYSNHPISRSLKEAYNGNIDKSSIADAEEIAGYGVSIKVGSRQLFAGNHRLMEKQGIICDEAEAAGTVIYVAEGDKYLGYILISDEVKPDAKEAIARLKDAGIKKIVMLTGDHKRVADKIAAELGITEVYSELLPGEKVEKVEELYKSKSVKGKLVFVGDGINDAPVLARADIGIAMGGLGSDAAIEAADIVIMTDEPSKIAKAMKISHKTLVIVKQNIVFAIGVKILVLILAAIGMASMWAAVFADVGVAVIAILNAMRVMKMKP